MLWIAKTSLICVPLALVASASGAAALSGGEEATSTDVPSGPLLLQLNPPYQNQPIADPAPPEAETNADEAMEEPVDAEAEAGSSAEEAAQPMQEQPADGAEAETSQEATPEEPVLPQPEPKKELTPAQAALRDRVRRTLALYHRQMLTTADNTATELMLYCTAFGCNSEIYRSDSSTKNRKVNGITCLCWNYPCAGFEPLGLVEDRIAAQIGYGLQEHRGQLLAVLALSRVPTTYPARVGDTVRTVADLIEHEKLSCRSGDDLSLKLIGLSYYLTDNPVWRTRRGEDWSVERILKEEIDRPIDNATGDGIRQLTGIGYAVYRRAKRKQPITGQYLRAQKFIHDYHDFAFSLQNQDGSWSPKYLAAKGAGRDAATQLRTTGHVLQWLALSLPEERLEEPRVVRAVEYVNRLLGSHRGRGSVRSLSTREIGSVTQALHALMVYDERFLAPRTPSKPAATQQASR